MIITKFTDLQDYALRLINDPKACTECIREAVDLVKITQRPGVERVAIHFDTECEHTHN